MKPTLVFFKSHVKEHQAHSKTGRMFTVKEHEDVRGKKPPEMMTREEFRIWYNELRQMTKAGRHAGAISDELLDQQRRIVAEKAISAGRSVAPDLTAKAEGKEPIDFLEHDGYKVPLYRMEYESNIIGGKKDVKFHVGHPSSTLKQTTLERARELGKRAIDLPENKEYFSKFVTELQRATNELATRQYKIAGKSISVKDHIDQVIGEGYTQLTKEGTKSLITKLSNGKQFYSWPGKNERLYIESKFVKK